MKMVAFILALVSAFSTLGQATALSSPLVYIRAKDAQGFELVSLSLTERHTFNIDAAGCFTLSPAGDYLAYAAKDSGKIEVYRLEIGDLLREIPVANSGSSCEFVWIGETVLKVEDATTSGTSGTQSIDVITGMPATVQDEAHSVPTMSPIALPGWLPDDFRLFSPDRTHAVYNRCNGEYVISPFGDHSCIAQEEVVIYDIVGGVTEVVLEDVNQGLYFAVNSLDFMYGSDGIDWSPAGRFLIYRTAASPSYTIAPFRIYDTRTQQISDVAFPSSMDRVGLTGFRWSSDEQTVAMWLRDYAAGGDKLGVAFTDGKSPIVSSTTFQLAPANWTWRRDGTSIVYIDVDGNLVEYDIPTGNRSTLDTNVRDIITR